MEQSFSLFTKSRGLILLGILTLAFCLPVFAQQVCNGTLTRPDSQYEEVAGATPVGSEVRDKVTGLIWQRCVLGKQWDGTRCTGVSTPKSLQAALDMAGLGVIRTTAIPATSWMVPTIDQLETLVERACRQPAINTKWFPRDTAQQWPVWSYSMLPDSNGQESWYVSFFDGSRNRGVRIISALDIRFVRTSR